MTDDQEVAALLAAFERWALRAEDEREARREAAAWIRSRVRDAGLDDDVIREVDEALEHVLARDFDA